MKPCPHHYDPTCEDCKAFHAEENKVELKPEAEQLAEPRKEKPKRKIFNLLNSPLAWAILVSLCFGLLVCWGTVPGFLKSDVETPVKSVRSFSNTWWDYHEAGCYEKDCLIFSVPDEKVEHSICISIFKVDVDIRKDNNQVTTVLFKKRESPLGMNFCSATILVPDLEDFRKWSQYLEEERQKYYKEVADEKAYEEDRKKAVRILPPGVEK